MMKYYDTEKVCIKKIGIDIDDDGVIRGVEFCGGCYGDNKSLDPLIIGFHKDDVVRSLKGVDCQGRGTSCPDQLARILEKL